MTHAKLCKLISFDCFCTHSNYTRTKFRFMFYTRNKVPMSLFSFLCCTIVFLYFLLFIEVLLVYFTILFISVFLLQFYKFLLLSSFYRFSQCSKMNVNFHSDALSVAKFKQSSSDFYSQFVSHKSRTNC